MTNRQRYRLGMSAYHAGRYADAIEHLGRLASAGRGTSRVLSRFYLAQSHYRLGVELFGQRRFDEAAGHLDRAMRSNPSGAGLAGFVAACYLRTGEPDRAVPHLEQWLAAEPSDTERRVRLALAQWKSGRVVEAMAVLREGLRLNGHEPELHYQLGVMLAAQEELDEAQRAFERVLALAPSHARAYERLAQCCSASGRHERARHYLERAHALAPGDPRISLQLCLLAGSLNETGREVKASWPRPAACVASDAEDIARLGEVITAEPDFVEAFLSLPASDVDDEVFATLAATLEHALGEHPAFADLHYHCGAVYRRLGRHQEAIRHAERAVEINPRYVNALILLAQLYGQTSRWSAGVARLEQAIRAGGDDPDVYYLIGQLCRQGDRLDRARQAYRRALELRQDFDAAREALAALPASA